MARAQEMAESARKLCIGDSAEAGTGPQESGGSMDVASNELQIIGPAPAAISRIKDIYRVGLYFKHEDVDLLTGLKDMAEQAQEKHFATPGDPDVSMQFDLDPVGMF